MAKSPEKTDRSCRSPRVFKTAWFSRAAAKARITDDELCAAIRQVVKGQADNLGGGVFKKRLNKNMSRAIILGKGARCWIYTYLFAKKDRENIDDDELADFRKLAGSYEKLSDQLVAQLMKDEEFAEICDGDKDEQTQIQE